MQDPGEHLELLGMRPSELQHVKGDCVTWQVQMALKQGTDQKTIVDGALQSVARLDSFRGVGLP